MGNKYGAKRKEKRDSFGLIRISDDLATRAVLGEEAAIAEIVLLFESMIRKIAMREDRDRCRQSYFYIDEFVKGYIECRLMEAIAKYPRE